MTYPPGNPADPNSQPDPFAQTQFGQSPNLDKGAQQPPAYGTPPPSYGAPQPPQQPQFGQEQPGYGQPVGGYAPQPGFGAPVAPGLAPAVNGFVTIPVLGQVQVADIGKRLLARLIDAVIYGVIYGILFGIGTASFLSDPIECTSNSFGTTCDGGTGGFFAFLVLMFLAMVFGLLYEWLMVGIMGATLGKMAMHIKVVDPDNGQPIGLGRAFMRQLIPFLGSFVCIGQLVVYLSPLFDNTGRMQGWHDKVANDLVIIAP